MARTTVTGTSVGGTAHTTGAGRTPRTPPPAATDKSVAVAAYRGEVRVTFPRLPDGARSYSVVERPDGVRYRVFDGTATSRLPHDLGHLVVEREAGDHAGFWGAVAAGVVFAAWSTSTDGGR